MTDLSLPGLATSPLGDYLSGVGLLRAVTRTLDPEASGYWHRGRFVLRSRFADTDTLAGRLHEHFVPEAIVSPWNSGSGFAANGRNPAAERSLRWVRESTDTRLGTLREAVAAGDRVMAAVTRRSLDEKNKREILTLCRNEFPDAALSWLDAAVALAGSQDTVYSRLLGTGGNFGRQDLSNTYRVRLRQALFEGNGRAWLAAALSGDESVPYLRDAVGQFDPGRAGGVQSSPWEKADESGFVNPWRFLLTVEGTLLFATAVVRRHGAEHSGAALPFQVRGSTSGHGSAAAGENALAELWTPEFSEPTGIAELTHLLAEGRARWRDRPATSGLDFARAVASLGVDRGIEAFRRNVFVDRHGQNPLAVPAGRIEVTERPAVALFGALDPWLRRLNRANASAGIAQRSRELEDALFRHATGTFGGTVEVLAALGRCHEAVSRSSGACADVPPLVLPPGADLLRELRGVTEDDVELRLAATLATARDGPVTTATMHGLRPLLSPVADGERSRPVWADRPALAPLAGGLYPALAEAARRRAFPASDPVRQAEAEPEPAVRGARIAFIRGTVAPRADLLALLDGTVHEQRLRDLLAGLLTVDWTHADDAPLGTAADPGVGSDVAFDLIRPFTTAGPIPLPNTEGGQHRITLRCGFEWPALLTAGHTGRVLADAAQRLRVAGLEHVIEPRTALPDGTRLAATLLPRAPHTAIRAALTRIAVLPESTGQRPDKEEHPA